MVPALSQAPTPTGAIVQAGQRVSIRASGVWCLGGNQCGGATGIRPPNFDEFPLILDSAPIGALIARIGNGPWVNVGQTGQIEATSPGELVLLFNDRPCCYADNSGALTVTVDAPAGTTPATDQDLRQLLQTTVGTTCATLIFNGLATFPSGVMTALSSASCLSSISVSTDQALQVIGQCFVSQPANPSCRDLITRLRR